MRKERDNWFEVIAKTTGGAIRALVDPAELAQAIAEQGEANRLGKPYEHAFRVPPGDLITALLVSALGAMSLAGYTTDKIRARIEKSIDTLQPGVESDLRDAVLAGAAILGDEIGEKSGTPPERRLTSVRKVELV